MQPGLTFEPGVKDPAASAPGNGGGGGGDLESLNTILNAMTLDINPIEANVTKDGSNLISAFDESGTVGGSWAQSAGSPLWEADGGGGNPCITIQGATDKLERSANASYNTYYSTAEAFLIFVLQTDLISSGSDTIFSSAVVTGTTGRLKLHRSTAAFQGFHYDGTTDFRTSANQSADTRLIIALRHLSGQLGMSVNGGAWDEVASGDTGTPDTAAAWIIGNDNAGANPGKLFRIAGDNAYPGDAEYANIVSLLSSVYGVAA